MTTQETNEKPLKKRIVNNIGMEFILVPGGEFVMGADEVTADPSDLDAVRREIKALEARPNFTWYDFAPKHTVTVKPFYMGKSPVTQAQWVHVMGLNKASCKDGWDYPIESISWYDAVKFVEKLNDMMDTDAHRLPNEAEWEFCCRAGSSGDFCFEGRASRLGNYAWYADNAGFRPRAVGQKRPNKFGLFDVHGLVWEWTSSLERPYPYDPNDGREDPSSPEVRVVRGGGWKSLDYMCRCGFREFHLPSHRDHDIGLRLAVS